MTEPTPVPTISTFVVRFWQEWSAAGPRWRGRIEHIPSGKSAAFLHEEVMWAFVQSFGITVEETSQSGDAAEPNRGWVRSGDFSRLISSEND